MLGLPSIELAMKMLRRSLGIVLVMLLFILVLPPSVAAQEPPQLPASYWGTVKIRSQVGGQFVDAPAGTTITAWVAGVERGRIVVTEPGKYGGPTGLELKLYVQGDILQGSLVEFYVNGFKADQTAFFYREPKEVNLTAFVPTTLPGDANGDGKINAVDITKVERIIVCLDPETPGADAKQDGKIDALDIPKVEMLIAGLG